MNSIWLSPTLLEHFLACKKRLEFRLSPETRSLDRMGTKAAVGSVVHIAIEKMFSGQPFETAWNSAVDEVTRKLQATWAPAVTPSPENWETYQLSKARIAVRAKNGEFIGKKHKENENEPGRNFINNSDKSSTRLTKFNGPLPWVEVSLFDSELGLRGIPDQVIEINGELTVVDHKTGLGQEEPTEKQIRQLLFYAWLVKVNLGRMPKKGEIRTSNNVSHQVEISERAVEEVITKACEARESFMTFSVGVHRMAATPSEKNCSWCSFRPACQDFLNEVHSDWKTPPVVRGKLVGVERQNQNYVIDIDIEYPKWLGQNLRIVNIPLEAKPEIGSMISVADFTMRGTSGVASWNTLIHLGT